MPPYFAETPKISPKSVIPYYLIRDLKPFFGDVWQLFWVCRIKFLEFHFLWEFIKKLVKKFKDVWLDIFYWRWLESNEKVDLMKFFNKKILEFVKK